MIHLRDVDRLQCCCIPYFCEHDGHDFRPNAGRTEQIDAYLICLDFRFQTVFATAEAQGAVCSIARGLVPDLVRDRRCQFFVVQQVEQPHADEHVAARPAVGNGLG